jgi:hypothetical protein
MAARDPFGLGLKVTPILGLNGRLTGEYVVEDAGLQAAVDRLRGALEGLRDAWEALPPGARERFACTITLGADAALVDSLRAALGSALRDMEGINGSGLTDAQKYGAVFRLHRTVVCPLLDGAGIAFEWVDPDMDYADDTSAYLRAFRDLVERLAP